MYPNRITVHKSLDTQILLLQLASKNNCNCTYFLSYHFFCLFCFIHSEICPFASLCFHRISTHFFTFYNFNFIVFCIHLQDIIFFFHVHSMLFYLVMLRIYSNVPNINSIEPNGKPFSMPSILFIRSIFALFCSHIFANFFFFLLLFNNRLL